MYSTAVSHSEKFSDDELIERAKQGDSEALGILVHRHQKFVVGFATRFLGNRTMAYDVAQDVFLTLWKERQRYQAQGAFRNYLFTLTLNRCRYLARQENAKQHKQAQMVQQDLNAAIRQPLPIDHLLQLERRHKIRDKLARLPENIRQVVILRYTHDLSLEAISEATGMPLGTVKSYLSRGLKRLLPLCAKDQTL